ncbi:archaeal/vacuolar-type H+-ATPase, subunit C [Thermococcus kodakarensis KOD1]|uniref:A-type ATP synthase subunit C n=1 Tax=Thermococcus kodakarensis (strain ATCC BAA-918 / JCM 12380 / KOD1) TaxID=69014 RepID=AATC_THEKO|nr:V-type ATP synthase subunit C [Thermococcus kodakarensis]Q5JDR9.1 RecName: Full=V-type ATP synthase subunit C; AltName: Full=V-ATPase subunit C [Thermococcus kodakarensis KOD1]WCN29367.1 V-type ATP synthase subunit C [Thermococcus kodakarensis]WCN31658.1 V-type ATP synthase subunit C [Thermococcus kodakarensis]BAD85789.1 archaeal/vacuolar-type H+-ATPase, subunit C [Thermococcus kodakarensis KOD1]
MMNVIEGILNTTLGVVFTWVGWKTYKILWKYTPYSYPNARVRAMEAKLLTEQRFNELAESRTLQNFVASLEDTDYKETLSNVSSYSVEEIERALDASLAKTYELMFKILPKRSRDFFRLMMEEWDVRNIANVVKAKLANEPASDYIIELGPMLPKVKAMAEAKTLEEILVILEGTPYEGPYQELIAGNIDVSTFETELYRMYYKKLLNYARSRKDDEKTLLTEFIKLKIDKLNLMTTLRGKLAGLSAKEIRSMLIPGGSLDVEPLLHIDSIEMTLAQLDSTEYGEFIRKVREEAEKDISVIERAFDEHLIKKVTEFDRFHPLSIAAPLAYVLKKEREVRKLRAMVKLIGDGLEPEVIKEFVGEVA